MTRLLLVLGLAIFAGACSDGDEQTADSVSEAPTTASTDNNDQFCEVMNQLQSGGVQQPPALEALYAEIEATAPAEIDAEADEFVRLSRSVSAAFAAAGAPEVEVDVSVVLASLSDEERAFVEEVARAAESGAPASGSTGRLFSYVLDNCP